MNNKIKTMWNAVRLQKKEIFIRLMTFILIMFFVCGGALNKVMLCSADENNNYENNGREIRFLTAITEKENKYLFSETEGEEKNNLTAEKDTTSVNENDEKDNKDKKNGKDDNNLKNESKILGVSKEGKKYTYDAEEIFEKLKKGDYSNGGKKVVFLTFDDGASNTVTPKVLDILKENDVKATFFILGKIVEDGGQKAKELVKREFEEGHAIGNHSYSHDYSILYPGRSLNLQQFNDDFNKNDEILKSILGEDFNTRLMRCPGGYMSWKNMSTLDEYLKENNKVAIDWNALSGDAEGSPKNAQQLVDYTVKTSAGYDIVVLLMHDTYGKEESAKALPGIIKYFKSNGYEFRTLA